MADLQRSLEDQLELKKDLDELIQEEPDNDMITAELAQCDATIAELRSKIAAAKDTPATVAPPPPPPPKNASPPPPPTTRAPETSIGHTFNTGDTVQAKYSADKQWYAATIIGKTGSSADPVYTVTFAVYNNTENKRAHEVRPAPENKKRKADAVTGESASTPAHPPKMFKSAPNGSVISAAPVIDTTKVPVKREPSKVSDGPTRMPLPPKKLKGSKQLAKAQSNWADFQKNGPKKAAIGVAKINKESQFRTNEGINARVGFTGSGRPMQKEQVRARWDYNKESREAQDVDDE